MRKKTVFAVITGFFTGMLNGLFGAGGGMIAVPFLKKAGLSTKSAHATSIAVIFPLSLLSAFLYFLKGHIEFPESLIYLPGGALGAVIGAILFKKISPKVLKKIFGVFILYCAFRLLLQ